MRIVVPHHSLTKPLLANAVQACSDFGASLRELSADDCERYLADSLADAALLSPLQYSRISDYTECTIIPATCVALSGFTNAMGIFLSDTVAHIRSIGAYNPDDFVTIMGSIILRERYEAASTAIHKLSTDGAPDSEDAKLDAIIRVPDAEYAVAQLDVSEEFTDMAESPLPILLWVVRHEVAHRTTHDALLAMADATTELHVAEAGVIGKDYEPRAGTVLYRWSDEVEDGLDAAVNLLFYHQALTVLPEIRILTPDM